MNTTQIWQHTTSGESYLVAVDEAGEIREAVGPLPREDAEYAINEGSGWFNSEPDDVEWITANADQFRVTYP